jgi:hypothetical protein
MTSSERPEPNATGRPGPAEPIAQVDLGARFTAAWSPPHDGAAATPELLPAQLARACTAVLPVDGAGISLVTDSFRVPLGASDEQASLAERLQFTQGEGPCLDAAHDRRIQFADTEHLRERWPLFSQELFARTTYRAVVAVPWMTTDGTNGALDLFLSDPGALRVVSLADAVTVTDHIVDALAVARTLTAGVTTSWSDGDVPAWLLGPTAQDRQITWVANGMLMTRYGLTGPDALALLRAYAYAHDTVTDTVAADLVSGTLDVDQLRT